MLNRVTCAECNCIGHTEKIGPVDSNFWMRSLDVADGISEPLVDTLQSPTSEFDVVEYPAYNSPRNRAGLSEVANVLEEMEKFWIDIVSDTDSE